MLHQGIEIYRNEKKNSQLSAGASEVIYDTDNVRDFNLYMPFNKLIVHNVSSCGALIRLDGLADGVHEYKIAPTSTFSIDPSEGKWFRWVECVNSSDNTIIADQITFYWAKVI